MSTTNATASGGGRQDRTRVALLGALSIEPMTGSELRTAISETIGHFWRESYGQIYPTLAKLDEEGLISGEPVEVGRGTRYRITDSGVAKFQELLGQLAESPPPRNALLLQIFFGRQMGLGWTTDRIDDARAKAVRQLALFDGIVAEIDADDAYQAEREYWLATVEYGRAMANATVTWADATVKRLSS